MNNFYQKNALTLFLSAHAATICLLLMYNSMH